MGAICDVVGRIAPATAIANGTTNFFTTDISAATFIGKVITITVSLDTAVQLYLRVNSVNMPFNNNVALTQNALFTFSFVVNGTDTFNFRTSAGCNVNFFTAVASQE